MIRIIIFIIIAVIILSYLGINIRSFTESDIFQGNVSYLWGGAKYLWNNHLAGPARYLWYDVFNKLIWSSFVKNMNRIKGGKSMDTVKYAPSVDFSGGAGNKR